MHSLALIFPHQLFKSNPCLKNISNVILFEDPLYFNQFKFHKKKIVLHRASMKAYEVFLLNKKFHVEYIEAISKISIETLFQTLKNKGVSIIQYCDTCDYLLERRLTRFSKQFEIELINFESPQFINTTSNLEAYFSAKQNFFLHNFYLHERKRLDILVDGNKPVGGKWSFDEDNRKKLPTRMEIPPMPVVANSKFIDDAISHVNQNYSAHLGNTANFNFPVDFESAEMWLENFLINRFEKFGPYEDAIHTDDTFLFHSVLTPALNIGLLTPAEVLSKVLDFANSNRKISLASLEAFIRQLIGWREFVRGVYSYQGVYQRTRNFWNHHRILSDRFYDGSTSIPPVDKVIKHLHDTAYSHHIERLMVMGNFMLLCEIDPDEVYKWFMEFYIDAYDWVMVPNVYGMSQFADGGLMSTKPYISGANYIIKMSSYKQGDWSLTWNSLYWRFIARHREYFSTNQRTSMIVKALDKMGRVILREHLKRGDEFLSQL